MQYAQRAALFYHATRTIACRLTFNSSPLARSYLICMPRMFCICMQPVLGTLRVLAAKGALLCQHVVQLSTVHNNAQSHKYTHNKSK